MKWPWSDKREFTEITLVPNGPLLQCKCGSTDFARLHSIVGARKVGDRVETVERGAKFACQRCPEIFCLVPEGRFTHDPHSFPPTGAVAPQDAPNAAQAETPAGEPRKPLMTPKARPRV